MQVTKKKEKRKKMLRVSKPCEMLAFLNFRREFYYGNPSSYETLEKVTELYHLIQVEP